MKLNSVKTTNYSYFVLILISALDTEQGRILVLWDVKRIVFGTPFNPLKTKLRLLYLKTQFVPRSKHFSSWL